MSKIGNWRGPNIIKKDLILYYNFGSPNSYYHPRNTTVIKDISGFSKNAILVNSPTYTYLGPNSSFTFDGTNDNLRIDSYLTSEITTEITVICVAKVPNMNSRIALFSKYPNPLRGFVIELGTLTTLWTRSMRLFIQSDVNGRTVDYRGTAQLNSNQTYMFTVVFKQGVSAKMYYNLTEMTATHANANWALVTNWANGLNYYYLATFDPVQFAQYSNVNISLLSIYNKALSFDQITSNYNALKDIYGL
jgi:hypothetical protein